MNREPDAEGGSELGDGGSTPDAFDAIVSGWRREGQVPEWPGADEHATAPLFEPPAAASDMTPPAIPVVPAPPAVPEEEHFVPPEPPPLPRLGPPAMVGLTLLGLGLVLIVSPGWIGVSQSYGLPLGLLTLAAGLGWLVLRLWPDPPGRGDGDDDGAVL